MKLVRATEDDNDRLKEFFNATVLPGAIDLSIRRGENFFDRYRLISDDFETLILVDDAGKIHGTASLVYRDGFLKGERATWGYATDLRIGPSRKAIMEWTRHFLPVVEQAREERRCRAILSALQLHDNAAYNSLVRPTQREGRRMPRYHLVNRFRVIGLHGRVPFSERPVSSIRVTALDESSVEEVCAYYASKSAQRPLACLHGPEVFLARVKATPGLKLDDFRIARDSSGHILGCAALWDPSPVQRFVPEHYHGFAATIHQSLWLASHLRVVRGTSAKGAPLPTRFLTHLACESPEAFYRLADEAFSRLGPKEFLSYIHFRGHWRTLPPQSFFATSLPWALYLLLPPNEEAAPAWPAPLMDSLPPEFDISWL